MRIFFSRIKQYRQLLLSVVFFSLFSFSVNLFAAPYAPGATLNPSCAPGSGVDCTVAPVAIGNTVSGATAGSILFAGASGVLAQDNSSLFWNDASNRLGIGTATPAYMLSVGSRTIGSVAYAGVGIDDATIGGTFTGVQTTTYIIQIDSQGGDTYSVTKNGDTISSGNTITLGADTIDNGLTVTFGADTGHDLTDTWTFTVTVTGDVSSSSVYRTGSHFFGTQEITGSNLYLGNGSFAGVTSSTDNTFIGINAGMSATGGAENTYIGSGAGQSIVLGTSNSLFGKAAGGSLTSASGNTFIGSEAGNNITSGASRVALTGTFSTAIGYRSAVGPTTNYATAIGYAAGAPYDYSIAIGSHSVTTAANQLVIGGSSSDVAITDIYFGNGVTVGGPSAVSDVTINGSAPSTSTNNRAGGNITLAGGKGRGNGAGGSVIFSTSDAGASGTTLQSLTEKMRLSAAGFLGIGDTSPDYMLDVVRATDGIVAEFSDDNATCTLDPDDVGGLTCSSDRTLKTNIRSESGSLQKVLALRPARYSWINNPESEHIGFIAQEVQEIYPEFISEFKNGTLGVNYSSFTPVIVGAIQEMHIKLEGVSNYISGNTSIFDQLIAGILSLKELIADKVTTKELCLEDVCIDKSQLEQLLHQGGAVPSAPASPTEVPVATPGEVVVEPVPESIEDQAVSPEPAPEPLLEVPEPQPEPVVE